MYSVRSIPSGRAISRSTVFWGRSTGPHKQTIKEPSGLFAGTHREGTVGVAASQVIHVPPAAVETEEGGRIGTVRF